MIKVDEVYDLYNTEKIIKTISTEEYKEKYVNLESTLNACRECPNYSRNWACPEFEEDVLVYWNKYENIELHLTKINFTQKALDITFSIEELKTIVDNSLFRERNILLDNLEEKEKEINGKLLSAGYCGYCEKCSRIDNIKCRYPDKCHNSIESIGGLVSETLNGVFNEQIKWIDVENHKVPENLSLLMALLY